MNRNFVIVSSVLCVLLAGLMGCEWETGDDASLGPSLDGDANLSGYYSVLDGTAAVTGDPILKNTVIGTGDGVKTHFVADLIAPINAGSVGAQANVVDANMDIIMEIFTDDGDEGLDSNQGGAGSYGVVSGGITLDFAFPPADGHEVQVTYETEQASTVTIMGFNVIHEDGYVSLQDNWGNVYTGTVMDPSTERDTGLPDVSESFETNSFTRVVGQTYPFQATGTCNGTGVTIVGTFRMEVVIVYFLEEEDFNWTYNEEYRRTTMTMAGRWIEDGGRQAAFTATGPSDLTHEVVDWLEEAEE